MNRKPNKTRYISYYIWIMIFSFTVTDGLWGQDKVIVTGGFGIPELLNGGVRFQFNQTRVGIAVGFIPIKNESVVSISGDACYHFGGSSDFSGIRPWYGKTGLTYLRDETGSKIFKYLYLNLRFGRDLSLTKKFGMNLDLGFGFQLFYDEIEKKPSDSWLDLDIELPVIPSLGICFYYRL